MSTYLERTADQINIHDNELRVLYGNNIWGNNYIAIPIEVVLKVIDESGERNEHA